MSLSINEAELPALRHSKVSGNFVAWNYLHAFETRENRNSSTSGGASRATKAL